MSYEDTQNISARCLLDVRFANLKDILHGCPKDISYSGKRDISQRQFLDILVSKIAFKAVVKDSLKISLQDVF